MNKARTSLRSVIERIQPWDDEERAVVGRVLGWIDEGRDLYRIAKPDVPYEHLVSYFVLVDQSRGSLLLVDHKNAGLWLPAGGHIEKDEDPRETVVRELAEELGPRAAEVASIANMPMFITANLTRGQGPHVDVSLWYVVGGDERMWLDPDPGEFNGCKWWKFDEVLATDVNQLDPQMHRFTHKLKAKLAK